MKKKRPEKQSVISIKKDEVLLLENLLSQNNKIPDYPSLFTRKKEEIFKNISVSVNMKTKTSLLSIHAYRRLKQRVYGFSYM
ncbi:hypothetical protein ACH34C_12775 [Elizabethkingia anophelis]|uniref:hypothetical protein n=1 Tax=Elizabethkingia anophelis TaxID=1117645 RepID=UPI0037870B27